MAVTVRTNYHLRLIEDPTPPPPDPTWEQAWLDEFDTYGTGNFAWGPTAPWTADTVDGWQIFNDGVGSSVLYPGNAANVIWRDTASVDHRATARYKMNGGSDDILGGVAIKILDADTYVAMHLVVHDGFGSVPTPENKIEAFTRNGAVYDIFFTQESAGLNKEQWYDLQLEYVGGVVRGYIDGVELFEQTLETGFDALVAGATTVGGDMVTGFGTSNYDSIEAFVPAPTLFPTFDTTGLAQFPGWTPTTTLSGDQTINTPDTVIEDTRINGDIINRANGLVLRRCEINGIISGNDGETHYSYLAEDSDFRVRPGGGPYDGTPSLAYSTYTARRCRIIDTHEGFRISGGTITIEDCWCRVVAPTPAQNPDWHGDALQGLFADILVIRNTYLELPGPTGEVGTSPFFYPAQGNEPETYADVDRLLLKGGGFSFVLETDGSVRNMYVVRGSMDFGPVAVTTCGILDVWEANWECDLDVNGQPVNLTPLLCS